MNGIFMYILFSPLSLAVHKGLGDFIRYIWYTCERAKNGIRHCSEQKTKNRNKKNSYWYIPSQYTMVYFTGLSHEKWSIDFCLLYIDDIILLVCSLNWLQIAQGNNFVLTVDMPRSDAETLKPAKRLLVHNIWLSRRTSNWADRLITVDENVSRAQHNRWTALNAVTELMPNRELNIFLLMFNGIFSGQRTNCGTLFYISCENWDVKTGPLYVGHSMFTYCFFSHSLLIRISSTMVSRHEQWMNKFRVYVTRTLLMDTRIWYFINVQ